MHSGVYMESEVEVAENVKALLEAKKVKRNRRMNDRLTDLRQQWADKKQLQIEYSEEIDRVRANDTGIEPHKHQPLITNIKTSDNPLKIAKGPKFNHLGEIIEEDEGNFFIIL